MDYNNNLIKTSFPVKLLFLFSCFFVCFFMTAILYSIFATKFGNTDSVVIAEIALQNILTFSLPAIIVAFFISKKPFWLLRLSNAPSFKAILFAILFYIAVTPAMNFIIEWNANISLPESMKSIEQTLRYYEESAQAVTDHLISGMDFPKLCVLILTIGILTGFGEEIFFRGILTRILLDKPLNKHIAIWTAAFIFSLMHFQFFGFVPRMLLGAFLGYILVWSDCLWIPIIAHAFNNSMVIISTYLYDTGVITTKLDDYGTTSHMLWAAVVSIVLIAALIKYKHHFFKPNSSNALD